MKRYMVNVNNTNIWKLKRYSIRNVCSIAMWPKGEVMRIKWERLSLSLPQDSFSAWGTIPERGEKHITTLCKLYFLVKMLWLIHEGPVGPTASLPRLLPAHHQVFKNGLHVTVSGSRILPGLRLNGLRAAWSFSISWEKWISKTLLCL